MISNATLTSHATPMSNAAGKITFAAPTTLGARCAIVAATAKHVQGLGVTLKDVSNVLYVRKSDLTAGLEFSPGEKLAATIDDSAERPYRIVHARNWQLRGNLSHWELLLHEMIGGAA